MAKVYALAAHRIDFGPGAPVDYVFQVDARTRALKVPRRGDTLLFLGGLTPLPGEVAFMQKAGIQWQTGAKH